MPIAYVLGKTRLRSDSTGDLGLGRDTTESKVDQRQVACSSELTEELCRLSEKRIGVCFRRLSIFEVDP
jgi:hypothetical protein